MDDSITNIIYTVSGAIVTFVAMMFRQHRMNKNNDTKNYQVLFGELRTDINRLRDEQAEERKQWSDERKAFNEKIDKLQNLIRNQDKAYHAKEIEVTKLQGQVDVLNEKLNIYQEARSIKQVTVTG